MVLHVFYSVSERKSPSVFQHLPPQHSLRPFSPLTLTLWLSPGRRASSETGFAQWRFCVFLINSAKFKSWLKQAKSHSPLVLLTSQIYSAKQQLYKARVKSGNSYLATEPEPGLTHTDWLRNWASATTTTGAPAGNVPPEPPPCNSSQLPTEEKHTHTHTRGAKYSSLLVLLVSSHFRSTVVINNCSRYSLFTSPSLPQPSLNQGTSHLPT